MTRRELREDNEATLHTCEQTETPLAMELLDWLHEDDLGSEGPTDRLVGRLERLQEAIQTHRTTADALEAHLGRMRAWVGAGCP